MENLFIFLMSFTFIFIILLINYFIKMRKNELVFSKEINLLVARFKLNKKKLNYKGVGLILVLINSLIIATTGTFATMNDFSYIWQLAIGFALLMSLIYVSYALVGLCLKRKEDKNGSN